MREGSAMGSIGGLMDTYHPRDRLDLVVDRSAALVHRYGDHRRGPHRACVSIIGVALCVVCVVVARVVNGARNSKIDVSRSLQGEIHPGQKRGGKPRGEECAMAAMSATTPHIELNAYACDVMHPCSIPSHTVSSYSTALYPSSPCLFHNRILY
jgi:hypothetical protein